MAIIQKFLQKLGLQKNHKKNSFLRFRNYQAGLLDRLTASFNVSYLSADNEIASSLRILRGRSRTLAMNNVYMRKFLKFLVVNVIGDEGITLQNQAKDDNGRFDEEANRLIEEAWAKFSEAGNCEVTGEHSLHELLSICLESVARDGEVLIRIVRGWKDNKFRFALQLLEPDLLDENYNRELTNGNKIVMGVEKDKWGRRVNYHLLTAHPGDYAYTFGGVRYEVVPASEIISVYMPERIGQTRGVPWAYAAMFQLHNLGAYTEAAIINARVGASKMGFYKTPFEGIYDEHEDETTFIDKAEPGVFERLPRGWEFQEWNPQYPHGEFESFNKAMLRGVSSGLLMAYSSISNDLADVNYSSIRSGKIDERELYKFIQKWFIEKTVKKIFPLWLDLALMVGAIKNGNGKALPYAKFDKFNSPNWQAKGFDWVDPKNDIEADLMAINFGLKTRAEVAASRGKDLRDIFEQLAREKALAEKYGLDFSSGKTEAAVKEAKKEEKREEKRDNGQEVITNMMNVLNNMTKEIADLKSEIRLNKKIEISDVNLTFPEVNVKVKSEEIEPKSKRVKKIINYLDLDGNPKQAEIIEEVI